ncbi:MAG TPA: 30S ribosomal protein S6 [candidate division Zixibacteria bacterium]|nr:30S ribosomal protein S6 [candidate division Zixibacteria bacterium]
MRRYDTTFILNPQIGDERINARINEVTALIASNGGATLKEDRMGNRRLAYEIGRQTHGYYVCLIHDSEAETLDKLDRMFTLGDDYLRHLTIQFEGEPDRKNITEVMMGFESERADRRDQEEDSRGPRRRDERGEAPRASRHRPAQETTAPAPATPAAPAAPATPKAEADVSPQTDEETL